MYEFECGRNRSSRTDTHTHTQPRRNQTNRFYLDWWTRCAATAMVVKQRAMVIFPSCSSISSSSCVRALMALPCSRCSAHIWFSGASAMCARQSTISFPISPPLSLLSSSRHCSQIIRWFVKPWKLCWYARDVVTRVHAYTIPCRQLHNNYNIYRFVRTASRAAHSHLIWFRTALAAYGAK